MYDFVNEHRVTATFERVSMRPDGGLGDNAEWNRTARHYHYVLRYQGRTTSGYFSQGSGITEEPRAVDILDSLAIDASCYEEEPEIEGFVNAWTQYRRAKYGRGWTSDGYTPVDERKVHAERARLGHTFRACKKTAAALRRVFGDDLYGLLMSGEVERL